MKYIMIDYGIIIPAEDDIDLEYKKALILHNKPNAELIICDTLEECMAIAPVKEELWRSMSLDD